MTMTSPTNGRPTWAGIFIMLTIAFAAGAVQWQVMDQRENFKRHDEIQQRIIQDLTSTLTDVRAQLTGITAQIAGLRDQLDVHRQETRRNP